MPPFGDALCVVGRGGVPSGIHIDTHTHRNCSSSDNRWQFHTVPFQNARHGLIMDRPYCPAWIVSLLLSLSAGTAGFLNQVMADEQPHWRTTNCLRDGHQECRVSKTSPYQVTTDEMSFFSSRDLKGRLQRKGQKDQTTRLAVWWARR